MIRYLLCPLCAAGAFFAAFYIGSAVWKAEGLALEKLPDHDYTLDISRLMAAGRFKEAEQLCCDVIGMGLPGRERANSQLRKCREERKNWYSNATDAIKGFVTGSGNNTPALAGAAASDFFIYGDIRDLGIQTYRKVAGLPVDTFIVTLSAIGTAAELTGLAGTLPSLMKMMHRVGGISASLMDHFRNALLTVKRMGRLTPGEKALFRSLNELVKQHGIHRSKVLLRSIHTPAELKAAVEIGKKAPEVPFLAINSSGRRGGALLLRFSGSSETLELLKTAVRKGPLGISLLSRIRIVKFSIKNIYQGRFRDIMVYEGARSPKVRRWLWRTVFFCFAAGLLFLAVPLISAGTALRRMRGACSISGGAPQWSPGGNAPDSSNSVCSDPDQKQEDLSR